MLFRRLNFLITKVRKVAALSSFSGARTMRDGFVEINAVPTHIFTWGQWIEDKFDERKKEMVLIITGESIVMISERLS